MKLAMTTLGAPEWDIETLRSRAAEYGYDGIDFRGYLDEIDVTRRPEFTEDAAATRAAFEEADVEISAISSSIGLCEPTRREDHLAEAERLLPVLDALGVDRVRVFGRGDLETHSRSELADAAAETMDRILSLEGAAEITWMVETHDNWIASEDCRLLLDRIDEPNVGALWDMGHTPRVGDESPAETLATLGDDIVYAHVKDAVYDPDHPDAMDDGWRYVTPGEGDLPLAESVRLLHERGYDGWLTFEHEKRWHPELPEPDAIFPAFVEWYDSLE